MGGERFHFFKGSDASETSVFTRIKHDSADPVASSPTEALGLSRSDDRRFGLRRFDF